MSATLKFGNGQWATKKGSTLAYNSENNNYKPLPFTFDRDSVATRVNKQGLIETVGADQPRVDYLNNTKGALKLEPSRTNLVTYSEDFSQSVWAKTNLSILSNSIISPEGILSADKLIPDTTSGQHKIDITRTVTNGATVSLSAFVKKGEYNFCCLYEVTSSKGRFFDLSNGTQGGTFVGTPTTSNIENYNNDWYRISISTTVPSTSARYILYVCDTISNTSFVGDNIKGIYTWGAQLEAGSYATSYIKSNSGSAVTRLADVCVDAGNDQVINSTEGVLYAEIAALFQGDGENRCITLHYGVGNSNTVEIFYQVSANTIKYRIKDGNGANINHTETVTDSSQFNKCAIKYKSGDTSMWLNGVKVDTDTSTFAFTTTLSELNFSQGNGIEEFYGNVKDVRVYNTALTDQELAALTQV